MLELEKILQTECICRFGNEFLFCARQVFNFFESRDFCFEEIEEEILCTPFYIHNNKRYELYNFEVTIDQLFDINDNSVFRNMMSCLDDDNTRLMILSLGSSENVIKKMCAWLLCIISTNQIKEDVRSMFGEFDSDHLYFSIY